MACHLSHKLPWDSLHQIIKRKPVPEDPRRSSRLELTEAETKRVGHFARCLVEAIKEFRDSDRSSHEERVKFDPKTWSGQREHGHGAWLGFYDTLPEGYVLLNLILMDPDATIPCFMPNGESNWIMDTLLDLCDGGHDEAVADHLRPIFDIETNTYKRKLRLPLTADSTQILRDHAAMLFRCMYSISGKNDLLDVEFLASQIEMSLQ